MSIDLENVHDLLMGLSELASFTPIPLGISQILAYAALLARLGDEAITRRKVLLAQLHVWITETRGPNTAELAAMQSQRDMADQELAVLEEELLQGMGNPKP